MASDKTLRSMVSDGKLSIESLTDKYINPASIDIPISSGKVRVTSKVFNNFNRKSLEVLTAERGELPDTVLESEKMYIIEGPEIRMPEGFVGLIDAKSTTGRLGLKSDLITEVSTSAGINLIPPGYKGRVWFMVNPHVPIVLDKKDPIVQLRLRRTDSGPLGRDELRKEMGKGFSVKDDSTEKDLRFSEIVHGSSTVLRASVERMAVLKQDVDEPIVFGSKNKHDPFDYWDFTINKDRMPIELSNGELYLLGTVERFRTGDSLCWKLHSISDLFSRFVETHRAGFVDPGFNSTITLEIKNHHEDTIIFDRQIVTLADWDRLDRPAKKAYKGHYQHQFSPTLPRQFRNYDRIWEIVEENGCD